MSDTNNQTNTVQMDVVLPRTLLEKILEKILEKMFDSIPRFVTGFIGSFLGIAMSIAIVAKMGGFEPALLRMANAYAEGLEQHMKSLSVETTKLVAINQSMEVVIAKVTDLDDRVGDVARRVGVVEAKVNAMSGRIDRLSQWTCDYADQVKANPPRLDCSPR